MRSVEEGKEKENIIMQLQTRMNKLRDEKERYGTILKEKMAMLDSDMKDAALIRRQSLLEINKLQKLLITANQEKEALKIKLAKLKARKVIDSNAKFCASCG